MGHSFLEFFNLCLCLLQLIVSPEQFLFVLSLSIHASLLLVSKLTLQIVKLLLHLRGFFFGFLFDCGSLLFGLSELLL
jgi:hypothetical protein